MLKYESVLSVSEYYDGPKEGIARYCGKPYFYKCVWDDVQDGYSSKFILSPLDGKEVHIAEEYWQMWLRWRVAYKQGFVSLESGPVLSQDRRRYEELKPDLDRIFAVNNDKSIIVNGLFKEIDRDSFEYEVLWTLDDK